MAGKTKHMHQVKQIIELSQKGKGIREIGRLTSMSRNTVREYLRKVKALDLPPESFLTMEDEALWQLLSAEETLAQVGDERYKVIGLQLEYYVSELRKRGVTRQLLWEEYRKDNPDGYRYTQFCEYIHRYLQRNQAVMHFTHKPGEQIQVDFAGDKLYYVNRDTGEVIPCEVLVCVLPYSGYSYAIALRSQQQDEFIGGICRALEYIGGVPESIKCDNLRSAVIKSSRYEPTFTEAMDYVAAHYGTTALTARVRKPRDKAHVEKGVDLTYKRIYAPLRHFTFHSLEELNAAICKQLQEHNNRLLQGRDYSRSNRFEEEKLLLKELPNTRYEMKKVTLGKVQKNYHVIVGEDRHQYSVPYTLIGKRLKIVYTTDMVEVYDERTRVALHNRSRKSHGYTTKVEHMPANHQHHAARKGWNAEYFEKQAYAVGPSTLAGIQRVLQSKSFLEQTYNSCLGILSLGRKYGNDRLEAACARALASPIINYKTIGNILKYSLDKQKDLFDNKASTIPEHTNLRGPAAYQ
jgi:transposase